MTHERSSVVGQKITQNGNALNAVDPISLTESKNTAHRQTRSLS